VAEALRLVLSDLPPEQAEDYLRGLTEEIRSGAMPREGLLEARRGTHRVGAAWFQTLGGRAAMVWPPRLVPGEPATTASRLLAAGTSLLARNGVIVAHALLANVTAEDDAVLRAAGFSPLAALLYLGCQESEFPQTLPEGPVQFVPYDPAQEARLGRLVEATYVGTLDCPAMNGLRPVEDVLAGYRDAGSFAPEHWLFVEHEGRDVGCLLLGDHPREGNVELIYMGLIPSRRGNGWGKVVCRHAQWLAGRIGRPRLVLAVDEANRPALAMYAAAGFQAFDRRTVYLKQLRGGRS
jgi:GNAT superfamily N-acetyltransferase